MRIALIGAGRIGALHGRLLAEDPDVEVIVTDVDTARARQVAADIGGRTAATARDAIAAADAVVIAASTDGHVDQLNLAIDAGLATFCEKPLCFELADTIAITRRAEAARVVIQVGFQRRFDAGYREARRLVQSGEIGSLYLVRLPVSDHEPPPDAYIPVSGGLFRDSSIHDFDILRWVTGREVVEVYATGSVRGFPVFAEHDDIDTGAAILTLDDGTLAVLGQTRHNPRGYDVRMELVGARDAVTVGWDANTPIRSLEPTSDVRGDAGWTSFLTRFEAAYRDELLAFVRLARGEIPSPCTARDGLEAMRIAVAAGSSRREHRPVRLDEIPA